MKKEVIKRLVRQREVTQGRRGLVRKVKKPPREPRQIERRYQAEFVTAIKEIEKNIKEKLFENLNALVQKRETSLRLDTYVDDLETMMSEITIFANNENQKIIAGLNEKGQKISGWNKKELSKVYESVLGVNLFDRLSVDGEWLDTEIKSWAKENTALINKLSEDMLKDVESITLRGLREGQSIDTLKSEIQKRFSITENRAKLIARDQTARLNSNLSKARQQNLDLDLYEWSSAGDERTRDSHAALDGYVCTYSDPTIISDDGGKTWFSRASVGGYIGDPGTDIQCRCVALPILDDLL